MSIWDMAGVWGDMQSGISSNPGVTFSSPAGWGMDLSQGRDRPGCATEDHVPAPCQDTSHHSASKRLLGAMSWNGLN